MRAAWMGRTPARPGLRLAAYGSLLAVVLLAALGAGRAVGPLSESDAHVAPVSATAVHATAPARGLAATEAGYALEVDDPVLVAGRADELRFRVVGPDGEDVRAYDSLHGEALHLIVVRRDLSGYQHLHPERLADGSWRTPLRLDEPGVHRAYADLRPTSGPALTLAADLIVAGELRPRPLPPAGSTAHVAGYDVTLSGRPTAGEASTLTFSVRRGGVPVTDLEPYLEARGHLVALRASDLAYLHVHPEDDASAGRDVRFTATFPAPGPHRLFLDFRHDGVVRTAALTVDVPRAPHDADGGPDAVDGHGAGG